ncbi:S8 family serine peptidase [Streptomyces diastatochromogenes]|nr:S8 family serine peptidase [Streptomyces diastatochromogenes]
MASAILESIDAGARIINLSVGSTYPSTARQSRLGAVLDRAAERGVLVVAAAGNQGTLGTSALTRHPWTLPVAAINLDGRPSAHTNLAHALGRRGSADRARRSRASAPAATRHPSPAAPAPPRLSSPARPPFSGRSSRRPRPPR